MKNEPMSALEQMDYICAVAIILSLAGGVIFGLLQLIMWLL